MSNSVPPSVPPPPPPISGGGYLPPPPPPPPHEGQPFPSGSGGDPLSFSVGNAYNWGWKKFTENWGTFIAAFAVFAVIGLVLYGIFYTVLFSIGLMGSSGGNMVYDPSTGQYEYTGSSGILAMGFIGTMLISAIMGLVLSAYGYIVQSEVIRGALGVSEGQKIEFKSFFATDNLGRIVGASLLVAVAVSIGFMLCYIPGIIVAFMTQYFLFFIIDQNLGAVDSIKASWNFVAKNLGPLILIYLVAMLIAFVGAILCGLGLLVAVPVIVLAQAFAYKTLHNQPIAA